MASNASRGAAQKRRAKIWLMNRGYVVADMEIMRRIYISPAKQFYQKNDQWGADLIAVSADAIVLAQVKSGEAAKGGTFPDARREFAKYPHPPMLRKIVIGWPPKVRVPRLVEVFPDGSFEEVQAV